MVVSEFWRACLDNRDSGIYTEVNGKIMYCWATNRDNIGGRPAFVLRVIEDAFYHNLLRSEDIIEEIEDAVSTNYCTGDTRVVVAAVTCAFSLTHYDIGGIVKTDHGLFAKTL